ncbi:hypothetical protein BD410DRAFT_900724 [Rickenella mellea]|uniref:Uncharacterized protein n=1 Tax=Rickenella mellea TaxID=50990 RepID=A0A4Y7PTB7_9AGAM|nr:hypothetical protein BD410DRAFT_900724 [Rickenella mellea]
MTAKGNIGQWGVVVSEINEPLTAILVNRLVLNLRQVSHLHEGNAPALRGTGTIHEPVFATNSFLGNLGAPLRVGPEDEDEIEEVGVDDGAEVVGGYRIVDQSDSTEDVRDPSSPLLFPNPTSPALSFHKT